MPGTLQAFLRSHREELIARWEAKVRQLLPSEAHLTPEQLRDSLPLFLDEIIDGLETGSGKLVGEKRSALARVHGGQRHHLHRNVAELVREYGLFFEAVVELSSAAGEARDLAELVELSNCLFTGAAEAVEEFAERAAVSRRKVDLKHFGFIAHELRNPLWSARLAWETIRKRLTTHGKQVDVLSRSLSRVAELIDETLSTARLAELGRGPGVQLEELDVASLLHQAEEDSTSDAELKRVGLIVEPHARQRVRGDARLLLSALTNVVRNAVKFTHADGSVLIRTREEGGRTLIEVQDECGGLPPERAERLFEAFTQANEDRRGFGLGLAIAKQAVEAQGGTISVKNVPDSGCIFVLDLEGVPS